LVEWLHHARQPVATAQPQQRESENQPAEAPDGRRVAAEVDASILLFIQERVIRRNGSSGLQSGVELIRGHSARVRLGRGPGTNQRIYRGTVTYLPIDGSGNRWY